MTRDLDERIEDEERAEKKKLEVLKQARITKFEVNGSISAHQETDSVDYSPSESNLWFLDLSKCRYHL